MDAHFACSFFLSRESKNLQTWNCKCVFIQVIPRQIGKEIASYISYRSFLIVKVNEIVGTPQANCLRQSLDPCT